MAPRPLHLVTMREELRLLSLIDPTIQRRVVAQANQGRLTRELRLQFGPDQRGGLRDLLGYSPQWHHWSSSDRKTGLGLTLRRGRDLFLVLPSGIRPRGFRLEPDLDVRRLGSYPGDHGGYTRDGGLGFVALEAGRRTTFWADLDSIGFFPNHPDQLPLSLQDRCADLAQAPTRYKPLRDPFSFAAALTGLRQIRRRMPPEQLALFERQHQGERLLCGLFYLPYLLTLRAIDEADVLRTLDQLIRWEERLGEKFKGDDLLERILRCQIPPFMNGDFFPFHYELEVARLLASQPEVKKIYSIIPDNRTPSPDYRVEIKTPEGYRKQRFVEVKVLRPRWHSVTRQRREKLFDLLGEVQRQFEGYPPSRFASGNTAHIAVVAEKGDVDPTIITRAYQDWGTQFLRWQRGVPFGRIDQIHFDFFGR